MSSSCVTYAFTNDDGLPSVVWGPEHKHNRTIMKKRCAFVRFDLRADKFLEFLIELANEEDGKKRSPQVSFRRPQFMYSRPSFDNRVDGSVTTWERDRKYLHRWNGCAVWDGVETFGKPPIRWPYPDEDGYEQPKPESKLESSEKKQQK